MGLRQRPGSTGLLDSELARTVRALKVPEAVDGRARRAGRELEQARPLLHRPGLDGLTTVEESAKVFRKRDAAQRTSQNHLTTWSVGAYPR